MATLELKPDTLVFFIDETGHELLNDRNQKVFGMGGCSVTARALEREIREPWSQVRQAIAGGTDAPLHASKLKDMRPDQIDDVVSFFKRQQFGRFGAICSVGTERDDSLSPLSVVARVLQNRIADIARWQPFNSVALIFEHSERLAPLVEEAFSSFGILVDGKEIEADLFWMPKSAAESGLEVADFIANAIGTEARHRLQSKPGAAKNFAAIFDGVDRRLASFVDVTRVKLRG